MPTYFPDSKPVKTPVRHREIVVQLGEAAWLSHFSTSIDGIDIMSQFVTTVRTLTNKGALAALDAAEQAAIGIDRRLTIAGVDRAGRLLGLRRMDGAVPVSIDSAILKVRTVIRTSIASKVLQDMLEAGDFSVTMMPETGAMGGGVPIVHDGEIVGAIAASGDAVETDVIAAEEGARAALA